MSDPRDYPVPPPPPPPPAPMPPQKPDCLTMIGLGFLAVILAGIGAFGGCTVGLFAMLAGSNSHNDLVWPLPVGIGVGAILGLVVWRLITRRRR